MLINLPPCEYSCIQAHNDQSEIYLQSSSLQTCFLFVAKTFRDSLSAGVEPKKSRADVSFCGVSLGFTGLNREKNIQNLKKKPSHRR